MSRVEQLTKHLNTLMQLEGNYAVDIANVVTELNEELGIASEKALTSYSTKELHEELAKREGVFESTVNPHEEVVISIVTGQEEETKSFTGPVRIIVNQD